MGVDAARWAAIEAHRDRLFAVARRRVPTRQDAEDVVSEAITRAAEFPQLDPARVGPFLTSVTVRLCADLARRRAREARALPRLVTPPLDGEARILDDAEAAFLAAVPLTPAERTLLTARGWGLAPSEVAAGLGMTVPAAKAALVRARRKLLAAWKATLGLLLWRRPRVTAPAASAVAAFTVLIGAAVFPHGAGTGRQLASPHAVGDRTPGATTPPRPSPAATSATPTSSRPTTATPPHATAAPARLPRPLAVPPADVGDGTAGHRGVEVVVDDRESLDQRLARCTRNGIDVDLRNVRVTCRE